MRLNKYVALSSTLSRRAADAAIASGRVTINAQIAATGASVAASDVVKLDGQRLEPPETETIMLNKPVGYVVSRDGQGSPTVYELLPSAYHSLQPVGRLDKNSSGLLLLTNDGQLANELTHPRYAKQKIYRVQLDNALSEYDAQRISQGIRLEDGLSTLRLSGTAKHWTVKMSEGRNRQIRRTFAALGYEVLALHRESFGAYTLGKLEAGQWLVVDNLVT